jgi:hypothetical protein
LRSWTSVPGPWTTVFMGVIGFGLLQYIDRRRDGRMPPRIATGGGLIRALDRCGRTRRPRPRRGFLLRWPDWCPAAVPRLALIRLTRVLRKRHLQPPSGFASAHLPDGVPSCGDGTGDFDPKGRYGAWSRRRLQRQQWHIGSVRIDDATTSPERLLPPPLPGRRRRSDGGDDPRAAARLVAGGPYAPVAGGSYRVRSEDGSPRFDALTYRG